MVAECRRLDNDKSFNLLTKITSGNLNILLSHEDTKEAEQKDYKQQIFNMKTRPTHW